MSTEGTAAVEDREERLGRGVERSSTCSAAQRGAGRTRGSAGVREWKMVDEGEEELATA